MKTYYAYTRVSTAKQGEGVSLREQKEAIARYADRHGLHVAEWFEEMETAAKRGRPAFNRMIGLLKKGKAAGVIMHKIDRSARNLKDWADLGELIDRGADVHFANESLDLQTRGGRLSADIQAVVAADYIRNLREETKKGLYGRLKQGIYPFKAPIGYLDQGGGKLKTIDPVRGPLVRQGFELYAGGNFGLRTLAAELFQRGLSVNGKKLSVNSLHNTLRNPFYTGLIRIKKTGETFSGAHEPLISTELFNRVQERLAGKAQPLTSKHTFAYSRLISCTGCGRSLIAENQKGHTYYRCHQRDCRVTGVREDRLQTALGAHLDEQLALPDQIWPHILRELEKARLTRREARESQLQGLKLQIGKLDAKLVRLTDSYLEGDVERDVYLTTKQKSLSEKVRLEEQARELEADYDRAVEKTREVLELARKPSLSLTLVSPSSKRNLVESWTSNRKADAESLSVELSSRFEALSRHRSVLLCALARNGGRKDASMGMLVRSFLKLLFKSIENEGEKTEEQGQSEGFCKGRPFPGKLS